MVYKLGHVADLERLTITDDVTRNNLVELLQILDSEYGDDRNIDEDDGGYVLYVPHGTNPEEIKAFFDYSAHEIEYVNRFLKAQPPICTAFYVFVFSILNIQGFLSVFKDKNHECFFVDAIFTASKGISLMPVISSIVFFENAISKKVLFEKIRLCIIDERTLSKLYSKKL